MDRQNGDGRNQQHLSGLWQKIFMRRMQKRRALALSNTNCNRNHKPYRKIFLLSRHRERSEAIQTEDLGS